MRAATLSDGLQVWCLRKSEAAVLDHHVQGYLDHGIEVRDGDTILDVGANIGIFGVRAVQRHSGVRVFALEPVPDIFRVLEKNASDHGDGRLVPLNCGAAQETGRTRFTYFPRSPALSTSDPSAWDEDPGEFEEAVAGATRTAPMWYARLVPRFLSGLVARHLRGAAREVEAELRTLSDIIDEHGIDRVDLLKVDCEGAELPALLGIRAEHWARVGKVVVEVHDRQGRLATIRSLLEQHGLSNITTEKEDGFEGTRLVNVFATRPQASP
ncbi:MAG: FkbM family methyltransferase [Myxococcota bacterium]|nr:FkbM family methyltransferase [Myxococcota bacterium]MEC8424413.1 FkbM family methyltransferase [Myxococcota bacterium]